MLKNTENSYGWMTQLLHWGVGIIILGMLTVGFTMTNMEVSAQKWELYDLHKATGLVVLVLLIIRLIWKLINIRVALPPSIPEWMKKLANLSHNIVYVMMFTMPISGLSMSLLGGYDVSFYGLFTIKALPQALPIAKIFVTIHIYSAFILVGLIIVHILVALYHHFIRRDDVMMKMIK